MSGASLRTSLAEWRRLLPAALRRHAAGVLALALLASLFELFSLGLVVPTAALLAGGTLPGLPAVVAGWLDPLTAGSPTSAALSAAMAALVLAFSLKALVLGWLSHAQARLSFAASQHWSVGLFEHYLRQPWPFHLQHNSAQLIRNVTQEVNQATASLQALQLLLLDGLSLLAIAALLLWIEPLGSLAALAMLGVAALLQQRHARARLRQWGQQRQTFEGSRLQCAQQVFTAAKDIRLLGREAYFVEQFRRLSAQAAAAGRQRAVLQQWPRLWMEWVAVCGLAALVALLSLQQRPIAEIVAVMALFAAAAFRLMPTLTRVLGSLQALHYGRSAVAILARDLGHRTDRPAVATATAAPLQPAAIAVTHLRYRYPGAAHDTLRGIELRIPAGSVVGFIGETGAGKSTLLEVLLGLLPPDRGSVCIDGVDIAADPRAWQRRIGYVPQQVALVDDSLRRNVAFGIADTEIDETRLQRALAAAQLQGLLQRLPEGLDTLLGERGVRLSGGERQRVGLARALYHDPDTLVLDEATSALDSATESRLMADVLALRGARTVLIVAHRLSTVAHCDRVYRLDHGRIAAAGSPTELGIAPTELAAGEAR